jgi:hypothetical protein
MITPGTLIYLKMTKTFVLLLATSEVDNDQQYCFNGKFIYVPMINWDYYLSILEKDVILLCKQEKDMV